MDFVTQLETISMFTDAYSRLIAYTFKFNLLSVTEPHYGLDKLFGISFSCFVYMFLISADEGGIFLCAVLYIAAAGRYVSFPFPFPIPTHNTF